MLALDPAAIEGLQRADDALRMLVSEPLAAIRAGAQPPVVLFDALDEAQPPGAGTALQNGVLRLVTGLHTAGVHVVRAPDLIGAPAVTTHLHPPMLLWGHHGG